MDRVSWETLPAGVRAAVEIECGATVVDVEPAAAGINSAIASTLRLADGGAVFCKGVPSDAAPYLLDMYAREAAACTALLDIAPALLWQVKTEGWWLLGFEHVTGRPADLSHGSPDLGLIAATLTRMAATLTPSPIGEQETLADRLGPWQIWDRYRATPPSGLPEWHREHLAELAAANSEVTGLAGETLLHTDLNQHNWLIHDRRAAVIDWSWTCVGPRWAEAEWIAPRLLTAGHAVADVAAWVDHIHGPHAPTAEDRLALLATIGGIWHYRASQGGFRPELAEAALAWLRHRWTTTATAPWTVAVPV